MTPGLFILLLTLSLLIGCGTSEPPWTGEAAEPAAPSTALPPAPPAARGALGNLPLSFEENRGQFDPQVLFAARHGTGTFFLTADSMAAVFTRTVETPGQEPADHPAGRPGEPGGPGDEAPAATENFALKIHFIGAAGTAAVEGEDPREGKVSYFRGKDPEGWVSGAATFGRVVYRGLWPGVDLFFHGSAGRLNAEYRLARAADAGLIGLRYEGQDGLSLDEAGRLVIATPWGDLHEEAPRATQEDRTVGIAFTLDDTMGEVGFRLEGADPDAPLAINP